jgi:hypothetical protein
MSLAGFRHDEDLRLPETPSSPLFPPGITLSIHASPTTGGNVVVSHCLISYGERSRHAGVNDPLTTRRHGNLRPLDGYGDEPEVSSGRRHTRRPRSATTGNRSACSPRGAAKTTMTHGRRSPRPYSPSMSTTLAERSGPRRSSTASRPSGTPPGSLPCLTRAPPPRRVCGPICEAEVRLRTATGAGSGEEGGAPDPVPDGDHTETHPRQGAPLGRLGQLVPGLRTHRLHAQSLLTAPANLSISSSMLK